MTKLSVMITIPTEKMEIISKRAEELSVTTSLVASFLLENNISIDDLSHVFLDKPKLMFNKIN